MRIGEIEIDLVSDGQFRTEPQGPFGLVPRSSYEQILKPDEDFTIPLNMTCILIKSEGKVILIETGLGDKLSQEVIRKRRLFRPKGGLLKNLSAMSIKPEDVDVVINTHLHDDHCGWNTRLQDGKVVPTFPRATYLVQWIEWTEASHPNKRTKSTYFPENFSTLVKGGSMQLLYGNTHVTKNVQCVVTPGHTRGHQSVVIQSGDWYGLAVSDMATYAVHLERSAWVTAYDVEPLENISTKEHWQDWAIKKDAWLFFYHDPKMPIVRLVERDAHLQTKFVKEAQPLIDSLPYDLYPSID